MEAIRKIIKNDVKLSRCLGLVGRVSRKKGDNKPVHADEILKRDGPFYCSVCLSEAIHRRCSDKKNHFAHKARFSPIIQKKDRQLHDKCRDEILTELARLFPEGKWAKERPIPANINKGTKEVIPDVSGRIEGKPIAIEVQASAYTLPKIYNKTVEYFKLGVAVIWIVPLREELGGEPFRPRLFEKYLHSLYFGKVYYYYPGNKTTLQPVHYSPAKRYIEESTWFDVDNREERTEGGYFLTYRTIKKPNFGDAIDLEKLVVIAHSGYLPENSNKEIPKCLIFGDRKRWWSKNEYQEKDNQFEVVKDQTRLLPNYEYEDQYDEAYYDEYD